MSDSPRSPVSSATAVTCRWETRASTRRPTWACSSAVMVRFLAKLRSREHARSASVHRDRLQGRLRWRAADQSRQVPRPQDARGVRLHLPALDRETGHRAPRTARLPPRQRERDPPRTPGHRQDPPRDRARYPRMPRRTARRCSAPPPSGSPSSPTPNARADSRTSSVAWNAIPLLVSDEVGYIPFDPQAANLMFMLVSRRYERASLIITSNKPFSAWGEIFGDYADRRSNDRPARPPRRDPLSQGRQLPPEETTTSAPGPPSRGPTDPARPRVGGHSLHLAYGSATRPEEGVRFSV